MLGTITRSHGWPINLTQGYTTHDRRIIHWNHHQDLLLFQVNICYSFFHCFHNSYMFMYTDWVCWLWQVTDLGLSLLGFSYVFLGYLLVLIFFISILLLSGTFESEIWGPGVRGRELEVGSGVSGWLKKQNWKIRHEDERLVFKNQDLGLFVIFIF